MATIAVVLLFARKLPELRRLARPIFVRRGILPEIAEGLGHATQVTQPPEA
jgi:hypothetical protein